MSEKRRSGIGTRLRNAFVGVSAFSLLAAVVGSGAMWVIGHAQDEVIERKLPAVINAERLVEHSAHIIMAIPAFDQAETHSELNQLEHRLGVDERSIRDLLEDLDRLGVDTQTTVALKGKLARMSRNIASQVELSHGRLRVLELQAEAAGTAFRVTDEIQATLEPAIAALWRELRGKSEGLHGLVESGERPSPERTLEILDGIVDGDVREIERLIEIRFRNEVARRTVEQLLLENDWRNVEDHRTDFGRATARLRGLAEALENEDLSQDLAPSIDALAAVHKDATSVFVQRGRFLDLGHRIDALSADNTDLSEELNAMATAFVESAQGQILRAADKARLTLNASQATLIAIAALAFVASLLIVWRYVSRDVLYRLNRLSGAVRRLARGELDITVAVDGTDELSEMADAVRVFRDNAERVRQQEEEITLHLEKLAESNAEMSRVMKALQESEERYDLAVEGASVGLWDWNTRTGELYWSPKFKEILGVSEDAIVPSFTEFKSRLHPDDKERVMEALRAHLRDQVPYDIEYRIRREGGSFVWVHARGQALWDANGKPTRMAGSVLDIQERKQDREVRAAVYRLSAEDTMEMADKVQELLRLGTAYMGMSNGLVSRISDDRYEVLFAESADDAITPGVQFKLGETYCAKTLAAETVVSFHHAAETDMARHACYVATGLEAYIGIPLFVNGQLYGTVNFSSPKPREGKFTEREQSFVALIAQWVGSELGRKEYIDSLKSSQEDLHQKTVEQRLIFDNVPVRIWYKDDRNTILRLNHHAAAAMGLSVEQAEGSNYYQLLGEAAGRFHQEDLEIINGGHAKLGMVEEYTTKDGRRMWLRTDKVPYVDPKSGQNHILIASSDVTTQKEAEIRLATLVEELQRSNAELEQFAYVASHDLKAPLRGIDNLASWIEEDMATVMNDDSREHLTLLRGRVKRLEALLSDLLAYSRVGRVKTDVVKVDMGELVEEIFDLNRPGKGYSLRTKGDMPVFDTAKVPMEQLLRNLFSNALKHHDRDQGVIEVAVADQGDRFEFTVTDDGPGIPVDLQDRIFGMFQTLKARDQVEGSGMGLAIVKKLVESLGCMIVVESDPQKARGTCFRFTWPKEWPLAKPDLMQSAAE